MVPARRHEADDDEATGAERRCLVTGDVRPKAGLVRFVVSPEGAIVPDVAGRLPGRGLWLTARRDIVADAVAKRVFGRAARRPVAVDDALPDRVEALLAARCVELIGLARRAGVAAMGFVKVERMLSAGVAGLLLGAADGARDGRGKLRAQAPDVPERAELTAAELGAAFGRDAVVHVALRDGALATALAAELDRLAGFRGDRRINELAVVERE
ncbi:MAG TPA: RNA-binding protein [Stellaceae bacterium]|nr:RNA-binding protein [Stellaceae bacterium]